MSVKNKKGLGIARIIAAAVFLFNPNISVIDPLPDAFGYLLLATGLAYLADLNETLAEARKQFLWLSALGAVQVLSVFWLFGLSASGERTVNFLLLPFVFGFLSLIFGISAFKKLFDGILYLGSRNGGSAVFVLSGKAAERSAARLARKNKKREAHGLPPKRETESTDRIRRFTYVFLILKPIMTVLPEVSALSVVDSQTGLHGVNWFEYISVFRVFAVLVFLPIGIVWLVKTVRYWLAVLRDCSFLANLTEKYKNEVLPRTSMLIQRTFFRGFVLLGTAMAFGVDFYLDQYNVLPDFLCALLLIAAILVMKDYFPGWRHLVALCGGYAVLSGAEWGAYTYFVEHYEYSGILLCEEGAVDLFYLTNALTAVSELAYLVLLLLVFCRMFGIVREHTGFTVNAAMLNTEDRLREEQKPLRVRLRVCYLLAVAVSAGQICYRFGAPYSGFEIMTFINVTLAAIYLGMLFFTLSAILEQTAQKYRLS